MDKKDFIFPGVVLGIVIIIGAGLLITHSQKPALPNGSTASSTALSMDETATSTSTTTTSIPSSSKLAVTPHTSYYPYGSVTLALNQAAAFKDGVSIRPLAVTEDSRCPLGVLCIQAGTTKLSMKVNVNGISKTETIQLGRSIIAGNDTITLDSVSPPRGHTGEIAPSAYRFTFTVTQTSASRNCYVGGCSGELCSDSPNAVSSCVYKPEYACYKNATCERQANGSCGWTQDHALAVCLANQAS